MANTSLAEQLKKLAAPHTSLLVQKKKKASLLFSPSEAASIDRNTFYEIGAFPSSFINFSNISLFFSFFGIGRNGLKDLIEINEGFEEFKVSLFDETSKHFERTIESAEVNEKLNTEIKKFLCSLSPYFLLKPTQQVLEWLINRYHLNSTLICLEFLNR